MTPLFAIGGYGPGYCYAACVQRSADDRLSVRLSLGHNERIQRVETQEDGEALAEAFCRAHKSWLNARRAA